MTDMTLRTVLTADGSQLASVTSGAEKQIKAVGAAGTTAAGGIDAATTATTGTEAAMKKAQVAVAALAAQYLQAGTAAQNYGARVTESQLKMAAAQRAQSDLDARSIKAQADIAAQYAKNALQRASEAASQQAAAQQLAATSTSYEGVTKSAAQLAMQHQIAAVQVKDFIEQVISGGSPVRAFAQQGAAVVSTYGGFSATISALGEVLNPVTLAIGAAAAVVVGMGVAYYQAKAEVEAFNKTNILAGNVAGVTAGQLGALARQAAQLSNGGTQGKAAEVLNQIAASSGIGAENMARFTAAAIDFERVGGDSVTNVVQAFKDLAKAPVDALLKLNETSHFLTVSVYDQVKALQENGQTTEAARVAQEAYFNMLQTRTPQLNANLGATEKAWLAVKDAAKGAWDSMLPRADAIDQTVDDLSTLQKLLNAMRIPGVAGQFAAGYALASPTDAAEDAARAAAKSAKAAEDKAKWDASGVQYLTWQKQLSEEIAKINEEGKAAMAAPDSKVTQADIDKRLAAAQERFNPGVPQAQAESQLANTKRFLDQLTSAYQDAGQVIAAEHQAGLISDTAYYDAERALIKANTDAAVAELQARNRELLTLNTNERQTTAQRQGNADKIKDNTAQIARLTASAAAQTTVLGIQQTSAVDSVAKAYLAARQAAQDYLDTLTRGQQRTLSMFSSGPQAQQDAQGRDQISDKYDAERQRIRNEQAQLTAQQGGNLSEAQQRTFDQQLALQDEFQKKALASYTSFVDQRTALEGDWSAGATKAWNEYLETTRNVSQQTHDLLSNSLNSGTDALANFLAAGKYTFNEFGRVVAQVTQQVLVDLLKIYIRQQLVGLVGSYFGGSTGGTAVNGSAGGGFGATYAHSGGVMGTDSFIQRAMPSNIWASAPRHHTGLASDEYAAVLRKDEAVLTPGQMRQLAPAQMAPQVNLNMPLNIINQTGQPVQATSQRRSDGGIDVLLKAAEQYIAGNVASGTGELDQALRGRYGMRASLGV